MHDAVFMRFLESGGNLQADSNALLFRQGTLGDTLTQCFTSNVLHDQEVHVALGIKVVDRSDVRVVKFGQGQRFSAETLTGRIVAELAGREDLQGHIAIQPLIEGAVDDTHSTRPDLFNDQVVADSLADHGKDTAWHLRTPVVAKSTHGYEFVMHSGEFRNLTLGLQVPGLPRPRDRD